MTTSGNIAASSLTPAQVEEKVIGVIADSLCVDLSSITLKSNLMRDLGAESIDFLDIMFRLEREFSIKIPQREIERMARGGLSPEEFETNGILQAKGAERMRALLPEINGQELREGLPLRELPTLFTVEVFSNIVKRKLASGELDAFMTGDAPNAEAGQAQ
ncbi:MAG: acyl carrier protein [Pseudomonadota bacterium]|jgi:acyl carrier protein